MNDFYTNVYLQKNDILILGYRDGQRYRERVPYKPSLFMPSKNNAKTDYRALRSGTEPLYVERCVQESILDARDFLKDYSGIDNFEVYGMDRFVYPYIYENFPKTIEYDAELIKVWNIDIETANEHGGFPNIETANEAITLVGVGIGKKRIIFGYGDYTPKEKRVQFVHCKDERDMLGKFLNLWSNEDYRPDIVTGWNCLPTSTLVWTDKEIVPISHLTIKDKLFDSYVKNISPKSKKHGNRIHLANGMSIVCSDDHKFPLLKCDKKKYTNLSFKKNDNIERIDATVKDLRPNKFTYFTEIVLRNNTNVGLPVTNDQLYMAGLIYTDGTVHDKWSDRFYQSDENFMKFLSSRYDRPFFKQGSPKKSTHEQAYAMGIPRKILGDTRSLIYIGDEKKLNVNLLSKLSLTQFKFFLSGLLDGDGFVSGNKIGWCNYDGGIDVIEQLCLWNGIFISRSKNAMRVYIDPKELFLCKTKRWVDFKYQDIDRDSSMLSEQIKFKKIDNSVFVRIVEVAASDECEMMDIETDTHYFVAQGIKTHNCQKFDIPYLVNRIRRVLNATEAKRLSPWGILKERTIPMWGREIQTFEPIGVSVLDYLDLYKKFTYTQLESYSLDHVAMVETGRGKLDYSEAASLYDLYKTNYEKFVDYNIVDIDRVAEIDDKNRFIELVLAMAFDAKVNFNDSLTSVLLWDVIIHNYLMDQNIIVPQNKMKESVSIPGGYVKDPKVGMHKWVVSYDLTSLYPHLIIQNNISPETLVYFDKNFNENKFNDLLDPNWSHEQDTALAANGAEFRKDTQGFLPMLMRRQFDLRVQYRKEMMAAIRQIKDVEKEMLNRGLKH